MSPWGKKFLESVYIDDRGFMAGWPPELYDHQGYLICLVGMSRLPRQAKIVGV